MVMCLCFLLSLYFISLYLYSLQHRYFLINSLGRSFRIFEFCLAIMAFSTTKEGYASHLNQSCLFKIVSYPDTSSKLLFSENTLKTTCTDEKNDFH